MPDVSAGPPLIGVVPANRAYFGLKDLSLLFDSFVTDHLGVYKDPNYPYTKTRYLNDLQWLLDQDLLVEHGHVVNSPEAFQSPVHQQVVPRLNQLREQNQAVLSKTRLTPADSEGLQARSKEMDNLLVRMIANDLQVSFGQNAQPVCYGMQEVQPTAASTAVARIILDNLPLPGPLNSWDDILDFKKDPDTRHKLWALKRWMAKLAKGGSKESELRDEIEFTIQDYSTYLVRSGLKTQHGIFETVIIVAVETLEDLVTLKWSKLAKSLLSVRRANVELLELEAKAPGRECAYIVSAQERFSS